MSAALQLDPQPQSVRLARAWVVDELTGIGRDDLADAAQLGVSELVTNAILHAVPPITVRLAGTSVHPRVEVHDTSASVPVQRDMTQDERLLATVGRGLGIVAIYSASWGTEVSADGKVVWFEPAAEPGGDAFNIAALMDLTEDAEHPPAHPAVVAAPAGVDDSTRVAEGPTGAAHPGDDTGEPVDDASDELVTIALLGLPVDPFSHYRRWYEDLRRELRLLALVHGEDYPVAREVSELAVRMERQRRAGADELETASASGLATIDIHYPVPTVLAADMGRLRDLLEIVDGYCRDRMLLATVPTDQQIQLRTWYLTEFERQAGGGSPRRWDGDTTLDPAS